MPLAASELGWLAAGVVLHLSAQLARGRGWHAVVRASLPEDVRLRLRDVLAAWVAGAGASGVLSARGGDALRIVLLKRRLQAHWLTLAGTLAGESVAETACGAILLAWALSAGLGPGLSWPAPADVLLVAPVLGLAAVLLWGARRRSAALLRAAANARQGLALLCSPCEYARRVLPWSLLGRALRCAALACFLVAFGLPVTPAAVLLVMVAHSGGRLIPLAPAGAGASLVMLAAGFGAATGRHVPAGEVAAFYVGMTGTLTVVGLAIAAAVLVHGLGLRGAHRAVAEALDGAAALPRRRPA